MEAVYSACPQLGPLTEDARAFYTNLTEGGAAPANEGRVLFVAYQYSWTQGSPAELVAQVYDVKKDTASSFVFSNPDEVKYYLVSNLPIVMYGVEPVLGAIIQELTYLGYDSQAAAEEIAQLAEKACAINEQESDEELENSIQASGVSLSDLSATPEERAHTQRVIARNASIRNQHVYAVLAQLAP